MQPLPLSDHALTAQIATTVQHFKDTPFSAPSLAVFETHFVTPINDQRAPSCWPKDAALSWEDYHEYLDDARDWFGGSARPGWEQRFTAMSVRRRTPWLQRRGAHLRFLAYDRPALIIEPSFSMRVAEPLAYAIEKGLKIELPFGHYRDALAKVRRELLEQALNLQPPITR